MNSIQHYQLKLTFAGPFISQATGAMALGLDAAMQRHNKRPVMNGSLIRGNIRHTLTEFAKLTDNPKLFAYISNWFGEPSSQGDYTPQRTQVDFDFFWTLADDCQADVQQRTRISIHPESGTATAGALQIVEDCFPLGSENLTPKSITQPADSLSTGMTEPPSLSNTQAIFVGKISVRFQGNKKQHAKTHQDFQKWISKALEYIPAMGSFKSVGWGALNTAELTLLKDHPVSNTTLSLEKGVTRFAIQLQIDRPFCLGRPATSDSNQIISSDFISGNVLKALLARLYNNNAAVLQDTLCFDELIISHAFPAAKDQPARHAVHALSLATLRNSQNDDIAVIDLATADTQYWSTAPAFKPDWKAADQQAIAQATGAQISEPPRMVVLRTEINTQGISEQGKLFSLECVDPTDYLWCAEIELCNIPQQKRLSVYAALQQTLSAGLIGIGKTKAQANICFNKIAPHCAAPLKAGEHIITLKTAARMLAPDFRSQGTNAASTLKTAYQHYWRTALKDQSILLVRYFAQQTVSSSYYHQRQYQPDKADYHPEYLSDAGSVFVLQINTQSGLDALQGCVQTGLPAHLEKAGDKPNWKTTPYLPEHGYGEISINSVHRQQKQGG